MPFTVENIFTEYPNIVERADLEKMLNIRRNTTLKLLKSGEIKSIKIGNAYKIPKIYVIDYLNAKASEKEDING